MEGPTKKHSSEEYLPQDIPPSQLDRAWEDLYIYRGNAFLDYMNQASEEDRQWAKSVFRVDNRPSYRWEIDQDGNGIRMINGLNQTLFTVIRDNPPHKNVAIDPFPLLRYPWLLPGDDSVERVISRDVLIIIYGYVLDPKDQCSFMRVNKLFHKAGAAWGGYEERIEKLLVRGGLDKTVYPFRDASFHSLYQYFFALCFVSCKTDKELSDKFLKFMRTKQFDGWIVYCGTLMGILVTGGHLVWDGNICTWSYDWLKVNSSDIILDENGFYVIDRSGETRSDFSVVPVNVLRNRAFFYLLQ